MRVPRSPRDGALGYSRLRVTGEQLGWESALFGLARAPASATSEQVLQYRDLRLRKESLRPVCAERRYTGSEQTRGARQRTIAEPHEIDSSVHQAGFERPLQRVERHHGSGASGMKTLAASKQRECIAICASKRCANDLHPCAFATHR